jgi:hypothetical protein
VRGRQAQFDAGTLRATDTQLQRSSIQTSASLRYWETRPHHKSGRSETGKPQPTRPASVGIARAPACVRGVVRQPPHVCGDCSCTPACAGLFVSEAATGAAVTDLPTYMGIVRRSADPNRQHPNVPCTGVARKGSPRGQSGCESHHASGEWRVASGEWRVASGRRSASSTFRLPHASGARSTYPPDGACEPATSSRRIGVSLVGSGIPIAKLKPS